MLQRWTLTDVDTDETMRLPRNPRAMGNVTGSHRSETSGRTSTGVVRVLRAPDHAFPWEFQGTVRSKAEYDAMAGWVARRRVIVTDHLGRGHVVIPAGFEPTPRRQSGVANPWLYDYTFKALYLGRQS